MLAAVVDRFGPPEVVRLVDLPRPVAGAGEALVRVRAAAVTVADARIRGARFPRGFGLLARLGLGLLRPRRPVLGSSFAGVVEAVGPGVTTGVGDVVAGMTGGAMGAHAEYLVVRADRVAAVPDGVDLRDAAGVTFGGLTALWFLRDRARLAAGESVLVVGASGAVGTNAVQLAKQLGATVTAVTSAANLGLVAGLGADRVLDYRVTDVTAGPDRYDVVVDCVGALSVRTGRPLLRPGGRLALVAADLGDTVRARGRVIAGMATEKAADVAYLLDLLASGSLVVVHDGAWGLADIVAAHRRVDSGRKRGNIVLEL